VNQAELQKLPSKSYIFNAYDIYNHNLSEYEVKKMIEKTRFLEKCELKVGCQVMLIQNLTCSLVNGSRYKNR
jgi:hypothetical protein